MNKKEMNKKEMNKKEMNKKEMNKKEMNKKEMNKKEMNKKEMNKKEMNKKEMNKITDISQYQSDFLCTYQYIKDDDNSSQILYQVQLLQAFNLGNFEDDIINKITEKLYEKYKKNKYIVAIINSNIMKNIFDENDDLIKFRMYFGYDTFHLLHPILCNLINNKEINKESYNKLIN